MITTQTYHGVVTTVCQQVLKKVGNFFSPDCSYKCGNARGFWLLIFLSFNPFDPLDP
jgi:hypothetical protein